MAGSGEAGTRREILIRSAKHDILLENITVYDTADDAVFGSGYNIIVRNIKCENLGHSCVFGLYPGNTLLVANWTVENIDCYNSGNSCFRTLSLNGVNLKNMRSRNEKNFGIELWTGDTPTYVEQNQHYENISIIAPNINGIVLFARSDMNSQWHFKNISFKNVLIDCQNACGVYYPSGDDIGSGVRIQSARDVTFDNIEIKNSKRSGFTISNFYPQNSNILIKNSKISNNLEYGIEQRGGNTNYGGSITNNYFWNNKLGNTYGSVILGSGNLYQAPPSVPAPTSTPIPISTPAPTSIPIPISTPAPTSTPIPISTPAPTSTPVPISTPAPGTEAPVNVKNGGFESGKDYWTFYTNGAGTSNIVSPGSEGNYASKLAFGSDGSNIQLYQTGVTLEPNTRYRLSFSAYSNTGNDLTVRLIKHSMPYTPYSPGFSPDLGTNWQTFTTEFDTTNFTSTVNDGRLMFWLAPFVNAGDVYYIDDIRLEKANELPTIINQSADQKVTAGQSATFSVVATGSEPLSYQWLKDGINIPGATSASYTTSPTTLFDHSSTYRVNVTNLAGSVMSNNATMTVNLINNGGFETETDYWTFYTNGEGTYNIVSPGSEGNYASKLAFGSDGSNVQLYQTGVTLEPNTRYRLSFSAYSNTGNDLAVRLFQHTSPYSSYTLDFSPDLGTSWSTFTTEFETTDITGTVNDGRLMFWFAPFVKAGDIYYIDDIILEKV